MVSRYPNNMIKFPLKFEVEAIAGQGSTAPWTAKADQFPPVSCAIPPEFMRPGGAYSPEDLFAMSLLNCLIATFKVYCEKSMTTFQEIKGKVVLTVDRQMGQMALMMTDADIYFDITGASDPEKVRKIMDNAIHDCAVSNSIKTGKTFHINVL